MASPKATRLSWEITWLAIAICAHLQARAEQSQGAYFLPEFALSPQGSFLEDTTGEQFLTYRYDDQAMVLGIRHILTLLSVMQCAMRVGYDTSREVEDTQWQLEDWMMSWLEEMEQRSQEPEELAQQVVLLNAFHIWWFWVSVEILLMLVLYVLCGHKGREAETDSSSQ